jgi:hypothetical protein
MARRDTPAITSLVAAGAAGLLLLLGMAPLATPLARVEATGSAYQITPALRSLQRFASAVRIKERPPADLQNATFDTGTDSL